ncbi:hypothetical protein LTS12_002300 [Elasticomyces elasticus]|nr:hypothetical protein LTS12_002300 [Elasticomyces elasticus]
MPPIHINGVGGRMIRDDQIAGSRRDSDVVENLDRTRGRDERYRPLARERSEKPVEDRYGGTWADTHDREDRYRRMAREAPRTAATQSMHNVRVANGGITKHKSETARWRETKREGTRKHLTHGTKVPALKQSEENEYGLAGGARFVKGEGVSDLKTSGVGWIVKAAESFKEFAASESKRVKIEQGVMEDAKLLIKCEGGDQGAVKTEPLIKDDIAEKTKAEHIAQSRSRLREAMNDDEAKTIARFSVSESKAAEDSRVQITVSCCTA